VGHAGNDYSLVVKERSGWLIPLGVFFVTACLSALVFAYYFAPGPAGLARELPSPTDATRRIALSVGELRLHIPANYLPYPSARNGGERQEVTLAAFLPELSGFSLGVADGFNANAPDSPVLFVTLKSGTLKSGRIPLADEQRLARIYLPQVQDRDGQDGPYGLRQYAFRPESGYHNQDLFFGSSDAGPASLLCDKPDEDTPSPNCLRDFPFANGLAINYRFKRERLAVWRQIDKAVRALVAGFVDKT
jgi:hypothetical protein